MMRRLLSLFRIRWDGPLTAPRALRDMENPDCYTWPQYDAVRMEPVGPMAVLNPRSFIDTDPLDPPLAVPASWHDRWPEPWDDGHGPRCIP